MSQLPGWDEGTFSHGGTTYPTYRKGSGPGVVVIHEVPGITPAVTAFAEDVVAAGFRVVMPNLLSFPPGVPKTAGPVNKAMLRICIRREFTVWALNSTSPVTAWLSALARELHEECGGPGVGAIGMCFSGGFALAMMVDGHVAAPVLSQPSLPFALGDRRSRDLNLTPADLAAVKERVAEGCPVLGLRYAGDRAVGHRFDTLRAELGDGFLAVQLPGSRHSVVAQDRDEPSVQRVVDFFRERLQP